MNQMYLLLKEVMATHSSTLAWKIPWTEEPGRLQSMGGHKESDMTEQLHFLSFLKEVLLMSSFSFSLIYSFLSFSIQQRSSTYEHFLLYYKKKKKPAKWYPGATGQHIFTTYFLQSETAFQNTSWLLNTHSRQSSGVARISHHNT